MLYECKALTRHRNILSDLENKQNGKLKIWAMKSLQIKKAILMGNRLIIKIK